MPDDCIIFDFDAKSLNMTDAEKRLSQDIFTLQTMNTGIKPQTETQVKGHQMDTAPDWDGNVPPDFSDEFGFLL